MKNEKNIPSGNPPIKHRFSEFFYNRVTYFGVFLALLVFLIECFLFAVDFFMHSGNVYLGILTYVFLPPFLILGLILIPVGASWKRRRVQKGIADAAPKTVYIDPSLPTHRNALFVFLVGTMFLLIMTIIGSYKAFQYTESVHFCGVMCHDVMKPEFTTYLDSPHARVKCVECHIGPGADWYVRSKLSGLRQVYHTVKNDYAKPIPTPVENLRPSKETCEHCHWPGKYFSSFELRRTYFSAEDSTLEPWHLRMLVHVGRSEKEDFGIHSHMYFDHEIYYAADDKERQKISWVKSVDKDGNETVFTTDDSPYKHTPPPPENIRLMDCIDCHNRPSHRFEAPYTLFNLAALSGRLNPAIPGIKAKAMAVLSKDYASEQEAVESIRGELTEYYKSKQAAYFQANRKDVEKAIEEVVAIFKKDFFPERKARWDIYPDNIGHLVSPGCFRCHDGEHRAAGGKAITKDCLACHTIIEQGFKGSLEKNTDGLEFKHPFNEDESWKEMNCFDCHTGS